MVIYVGTAWQPVYLAAALHLGPLPERAPAEVGVQALGPSVRGLSPVGQDESGRLVCTLVHPARGDVVQRAFNCVTALAGLAAGSVHVVTVPTGVNALAGVLLRRLEALARAPVAAWWQGRLRRCWPEIQGAVTAARSAVFPGFARQAAQPLCIYYCYGGAHTSVTAANIHLGRLPAGSVPDTLEIMRQPRFDHSYPGEIGSAVLMGRDARGWQVYCLGLTVGSRVLAEALEQVLGLAGVPAGEVRLVNALHVASLWLRAGGFMSRQLGLVSVGRPLCALAVRQRYAQFAELVRKVQESLPWRP